MTVAVRRVPERLHRDEGAGCADDPVLVDVPAPHVLLIGVLGGLGAVACILRVAAKG
jgi:hypothetical protein